MAGRRESNRSERIVLYSILAVVLLGLFVWAVVALNRARTPLEARSKASELDASHEQAGLGFPSEDLVVRTPGSHSCRNADNALN